MRTIISIALGTTLCLTIGCGGGGAGDATPIASAPAAPTNTPARTAAPSPSPTHIPVVTYKPGVDKSNPIPIGSPAVYPDGWEITVLSTVPDATAQILAHDPTNVAPAEGRQYFLATVQVKYVGTEPTAQFAAGFSLRGTGQSGVLYDLEAACGVIPDEVPGTDVTPGGTVTGNVCWNVRSDDAPTLLMYYRPVLGVNVGIQYSALH